MHIARRCFGLLDRRCGDWTLMHKCLCQVTHIRITLIIYTYNKIFDIDVGFYRPNNMTMARRNCNWTLHFLDKFLRRR